MRRAAAAALALAATTPAPAAAKTELTLHRVAADDGVRVVSVERPVRGSAGRRHVRFRVTIENVHTGGIHGLSYHPLQPAKQVNAQVICPAGAVFVFGTTRRDVRVLRARFADGSTARIALRRAPRAWRPHARVFGRSFQRVPVVLLADGRRIRPPYDTACP